MRPSSTPVHRANPHLRVLPLRTRIHRAHQLLTQLPVADRTAAAVVAAMKVAADHTAAAAITTKLQPTLNSARVLIQARAESGGIMAEG